MSCKRLAKTKSTEGKGGGVLQDRTNHSAITLTAVTKSGVLIAATACAVVPMPKRN